MTYSDVLAVFSCNDSYGTHKLAQAWLEQLWNAATPKTVCLSYNGKRCSK